MHPGASYPASANCQDCGYSSAIRARTKKAVLWLKKTIEKQCVRLSVFASCDAEKLRVGDEWSKKIHSELNRADWLVLLYTTANENWDWCIYEAGYFAGRQSVNSDADTGGDPPTWSGDPTPVAEMAGHGGRVRALAGRF